ncbi:hypothetical protein MesoLjLc_04350 [Mesorhizobium sp. L-8-10]|nr:hypothetical protein [Mesorhizobium sp. L-8-3]BCH20661.1 hypothetical protein MesoLjLb_04460 [Mesorhizobium sp. L-8-3]BCH28505.1 hypothetical protein MesoLjLc_04350 [Mesorhizobium sp. L-8-10]
MPGRLLGRGSPATPSVWRMIPDARRLRLERSAGAKWDERSRQSEGCCVPRANLRDWTPEAPWRACIQLWEAEAAFRNHNSEFVDAHLASEPGSRAGA